MPNVSPQPLLSAALVSVCTERGELVGSGFLVTPQHVLTCAHVVLDALGLPLNTADAPTAPLRLRFPFLSAAAVEVEAVVQVWHPIRDGARWGEYEDVAVLQLLQAAPEQAEAVPLVVLETDQFFGRTVRMFGVPTGRDQGDWLQGELQGPLANSWVQLDHHLGRRSTAPGFSGTAVWDIAESAVAGMMVAADTGDGVRSAYMLPAAALLRAWPELDSHSRARNPYRGLQPFREQDAEFFFGRQHFCQQLQQVVQRQPLVVLAGSSGSGKSSLVFAGLIPALRRQGQWLICTMRPGIKPLYELAVVLAALLYDDELERLEQGRRLAGLLAEASVGLNDVLQRVCGKHRVEHVLLVLDQFEELYTHSSPAEQSCFLSLLHGVAEAGDGNKHLLLTLRADFLGEVAASPTFASLLNHDRYPPLLLPAMSEAELVDAILLPAQKAGVRLEEGLQSLILQDVSREPGALPLLEFALAQLWENQQQRRLTVAVYHRLGGVGLALTHHADRVLSQFGEDERDHLRRVLIQLVHPGQGTSDTRQLVTRDQLGEDYWRWVTRLADTRLVVTKYITLDASRQPGGAGHVEVEAAELIHEALIQHWEPLRQWMREHREFRVWQNGLHQGLSDWENSGRDEGALLRGARLVEAEERLAERGEDVGPLGREYIQLSLELRQREVQQAQQRQRERERMQRRLNLSLSLGLVGALILSGLAVWQWQQTAAAKQVAKARQLGAQALLAAQLPGEVNGYYDTALLLASQAMREAPKLEVYGNLLSVQQLQPKLNRYLRGHQQRVRDLSFSPDGKYLASAGSDKQVLLWDLSAQQWAALPGVCEVQDTVWALAFSPDSTTLACATAHSVVLWDMTRQQLRGRLSLEPSAKFNALSLAFSPDGSLLAAAVESSVQLWRVATLEPAGAALHGHSSYVLSVAFSPDGQWLASAGMDNNIVVWDVAQRQQQGEPLRGHAGDVSSVAFSPDSKYLVSGGRDSNLMVWDRATHALLGKSLRAHSADVTSVAFSPDGQYLATASVDKSVLLWDAATQSRLGPALRAHHGEVVKLAFSADSRWLASAGADGEMVLWEPGQTTPLGQVLSGHAGKIRSVSFSPDSQWLVSSGLDKNVILWDVVHGQALLQGFSEYVLATAFSPDGRQFASASYQEIQFFAMAAEGVQAISRLGTPLKAHEGYVTSLAFSPDGHYLASAGADGAVRLWDAATHAPIGEPMRGHRDEVNSVAFSPDGEHLLSAGDDGSLHLWSVSTQAEVAKAVHKGKISQAVFSLDGRWVASASSDKTIRLWDGRNLQAVGLPMRGHTDKVLALAFHREGWVLASGGADHSIVLWDVERQTPLAQTLDGHEGAVNSLAFSADGQWLASGSDDQNIMLWAVEPQAWLQRGCRILGRNFTRSEWKRFMGDEAYTNTCAEYPGAETDTTGESE